MGFGAVALECLVAVIDFYFLRDVFFEAKDKEKCSDVGISGLKFLKTGLSTAIALLTSLIIPKIDKSVNSYFWTKYGTSSTIMLVAAGLKSFYAAWDGILTVIEFSNFFGKMCNPLILVILVASTHLSLGVTSFSFISLVRRTSLNNEVDGHVTFFNGMSIGSSPGEASVGLYLKGTGDRSFIGNIPYGDHYYVQSDLLTGEAIAITNPSLSSGSLSFASGITLAQRSEMILSLVSFSYTGASGTSNRLASTSTFNQTSIARNMKAAKRAASLYVMNVLSSNVNLDIIDSSGVKDTYTVAPFYDPARTPTARFYGPIYLRSTSGEYVFDSSVDGKRSTFSVGDYTINLLYLYGSATKSAFPWSTYLRTIYLTDSDAQAVAASATGDISAAAPSAGLQLQLPFIATVVMVASLLAHL